MSAQSSLRSTDSIPPERWAILDQIIRNRLPRRLIHIKTAGEPGSQAPEIDLVSASQLPSIFESELCTILHPDTNPGMSSRETTTRLRDLFRFAIFSHRWFSEGEPLFHTTSIPSPRPFTKGYHKLISFCEKAASFGCKFAWSDTCCINKVNLAEPELDGAVRSMFRWYCDAYVCIVYLSSGAESISTDELEKDEWFTRGWTLQELLAPKRTKFYGKNWRELTDLNNDKVHDELMWSVSKITNISIHDLRYFQPGTDRIREKMLWASKRRTTRTEDIAYSLFGIFDINLPIAYGEGTQAFHRLMEEIVHKCGEWGIFAWAGPPSTYHVRTSAIPQSPACYQYVQDSGRFPSEAGYIHGDTTFTLSRDGLFLMVMIAIGDLERKVDAPGEEHYHCHYEFTVSPSHAGPTFTTIHVESSNDFIDIEAYEWAIGILNYRQVQPYGKYGKLEGGKSYVSFLLRRRGFKEPWMRVPTDNILVVHTLFAGESREPLCGLWV